MRPLIRALSLSLLAIATTSCQRVTTPAKASQDHSVAVDHGIAVVDRSFLVTTEGIGRATIGMTKAEFEAATGAQVVPNIGCGDNPVDILGGPVSMGIVLTRNDSIHAITISDTRYVTPEGARVGTTRAELQKIYGERLLSFPYKFDSDPPQYGQYGVAAEDHSRIIIFTMKQAQVSFVTVIRGDKGFSDLCI